MLQPLRTLAISMCFLLALAAHAAPPETPEEPILLTAGKGLITQIDQMRVSVTDKSTALLANALGFLGVPYKRGGSSADTGFDCSGFVKATFEQTLGLILPRRAEQQAAVTEKIDKTELQPGDLVFFNTMRRAFSHVGIYLGDGQFVHSPKPGAQVRVESMDIAYWRKRFDGARRILTLSPEPDPVSLVNESRNSPPVR
ncbi:C40 family peptidase [Rhodoferax sp.]|uniref:C40 family peptidase n=1 Tax=Rhodoferax sp. TaxID=50421 RepID=UPI002608E42E|nr:C40 family peptidase [Rhodoferax sp.]MDD5480555.1 C40 family peptidase [Rhodoferax sp.]